jgi:hypothetical protein
MKAIDDHSSMLIFMSANTNEEIVLIIHENQLLYRLFINNHQASPVVEALVRSVLSTASDD